MADPGHRSFPPPAFGRGLGAAVLGAAMLGALLLFVGEFTTLFSVQTPSSTGAWRSVQTGSHHAWAMALIAVVAAAFIVGVWRVGSRPALLALGVLGVIALLISLFGDLPDAQASGLVKIGVHYVLASATPQAGLYLDTLGGALLVIASASSFILLGPPAVSAPRRTARGGESG